MKLNIILFILSIIIFKFTYCQYDLLETTNKNNFGKNLIDLIKIKHLSEINKNEIVDDLQKILISLSNEFKNNKEKLNQLKNECLNQTEQFVNNINYIKIKESNINETIENKKQIFNFYFEKKNNFKNLFNFLKGRNETNFSIVENLNLLNSEKLKTLNEMKSIISEILNNFVKITDKDKEFKKEIKIKLNLIDDNFFKIILNNAMNLINTAKIVPTRILTILKKTKTIIKNKIISYENLENVSLLTKEANKFKIDLEINDAKKELDLIEQDVKLNEDNLSEIKNKFGFINEENNKLNKIREIVEDECKENKEKLESIIKDQKTEVSIGKMIKEFTIKDFKIIIDYFNKNNIKDDDEDEDFE